jgi:hypothetical protein
VLLPRLCSPRPQRYQDASSLVSSHPEREEQTRVPAPCPSATHTFPLATNTHLPCSMRVAAPGPRPPRHSPQPYAPLPHPLDSRLLSTTQQPPRTDVGTGCPPAVPVCAPAPLRRRPPLYPPRARARASVCVVCVPLVHPFAGIYVLIDIDQCAGRIGCTVAHQSGRPVYRGGVLLYLLSLALRRRRRCCCL